MANLWESAPLAGAETSGSNLWENAPLDSEVQTSSPVTSPRPMARPMPDPQAMPAMPQGPAAAPQLPQMPANLLPGAGMPSPAVATPPSDYTPVGAPLSDLLAAALDPAAQTGQPAPEGTTGYGSVPRRLTDADYLDQQAAALETEYYNMPEEGRDALAGEIALLRQKAADLRVGATTESATEFQSEIEQAAIPRVDPFEGEGAVALTQRRSQEVVQGGSGVIESNLRATAQRGVSVDRQRAESAREARTGIWQDQVDDLNLALQNPDLTVAERQRMTGIRDDLIIGQGSLQGMEDEPITPMGERWGAKAAESLSDWTDDTFGVPPKDDSFWSKLAYGGGSAAAFILPAILTQGRTVGLAVTAQMGSDAARMEAYDAALAYGATPEEADQAARFASVLGYSEAVPIAAALRYLPKSAQQDLTSRLGRMFAEALKNGTEEAFQESMTAVGQNMIAQGIYDPERDLINGEVGTQGLVGFVLGAMLGTGAQARREVGNKLAEPTLGSTFKDFANSIDEAEFSTSPEQEAINRLAVMSSPPDAQRQAPGMPVAPTRDASPTAEAGAAVVPPEETDRPNDETSEAPIPQDQVTAPGTPTAEPAPLPQLPTEFQVTAQEAPLIEQVIEQAMVLPMTDNEADISQIEQSLIRSVSQLTEAVGQERANQLLSGVREAVSQALTGNQTQAPAIEGDQRATGTGVSDNTGRGQPVSGDGANGTGQPVVDGGTETGTAQPAAAEGAAGSSTPTQQFLNSPIPESSIKGRVKPANPMTGRREWVADITLPNGQTVEVQIAEDFDGGDPDFGAKTTLANLTARSILSPDVVADLEAADVGPQPVSAPTVSRKERDADGDMVTYVNVNGAEVPMKRMAAAEAYGLGGWHRLDRGFSATDNTFLGNTVEDALAALAAEQSQDGQNGQNPVRQNDAPQASESAQPIESIEQTPPVQQGEQSGQNGQNTSAPPVPTETSEAAKTPPPDDYDKTFQKVRQGASRGAGSMDKDTRAELRAMAQQIADNPGANWHADTAQRLIRQIDAADAKEAGLEGAQSELDELTAQIEARNAETGNRLSPKMAEAQFNKDMDEIAAEVASLKEKYDLADDDVLTFDYKFRRGTGTTAYKGKKIDAAGEELARFKKDMGRPAVKVNLNNSKGAKKQPRNKVTKMGKMSDVALSDEALSNDVAEDQDTEADEGLEAFAKEQQERTKRTKPQPQGSVGPTFNDFSFTNRLSVFTSAFKAAGIEPGRGRLLPAAQQINILRRVIKSRYGIEVVMPTRRVKKKTITGRTKIIKRERIKDRDAIDQLLDAYRQLEMMAHVLGVPHEGLGLKHPSTGEALRLSLDAKLPGALGMYSYDPDTGGKRTIHLPGRSNSFAHEWGHALDHWLAMHLKNENVSQMLSVEAQSQGIIPHQTNSNRIGVVFADLMHGLFGDNAKMAALQIELQTDAASTDKRKADRARKVMRDLKAGKRLPKSLMSKYFTSSKEFGDMFGKGAYFANPAEMLARAFEAYVGVKAEQVSDLPAGFLSKGDWAYTHSEETRASMTFPREADMVRITQAFDRLGSAIRTSGAFGSKQRAKAPDDSGAIDLRDFDRFTPMGGLIEQEVNSFREWAQQERRKVKKKLSDPRTWKDAASWHVDTARSYLREIVERQPAAARPALTNLLDMFVDDPASGRKRAPRNHLGKTIYRPWEDAVEAVYRIYVNRLDTVVRENKLRGMNAAEKLELRRYMTDDTGTFVPTSQRVKEAAPQLRALMDDLWRYMDESGVKVGYTKNGYLPRIPDMDMIGSDGVGFVAAAKQVYEVQFDRDVASGDVEAQVADLKTLIKRLTRYKTVDMQGNIIERNLLGQDQRQAVKEWQAAMKALRKADRDLKKAQDRGGDTDAAQEARDDAYDAFLEAHEVAMEAIRDGYSTSQAEAWHSRIGMGSGADYEARGPRSSFTKKRDLPPETDRIMAEYYQQDPLTLMYDYIMKAPRRAEYVARVGADSAYIENTLQAAKNAGASVDYVNEIRSTISLLTGQEGGFTHSQTQTVSGWVYVGATMYMLKRAAYSSIAEPVSAGIRLRQFSQSLRALGSLFGHLVRTGNAADRAELARAIGLVTSAAHESMMMNRFGGDVDPSRLQGKALAEFFRYTMLTPLTTIQRTAMLAVTQNAIKNMLVASVGKNSKWAVGELQDIGIPKEHHADLLAWLDQFGEGFPKSDDMKNQTGRFAGLGQELWAAANVKLVDQIIQNPRRYSRPGAAMEGRIKAMYGITGFIFSFYGNVMLPLTKYEIDMNKGTTKADYARYVGRRTYGTGKNLAMASPSIATLMAGSVLAYILRLAMTDLERLEKLMEMDDEELYDELLKQAITRSGVLGVWDIPYNIATGVKYSRDLASHYAGPHRNLFLGHLEDAVGPVLGRNSPDNNTAENKSVNAVADLTIGMGVPLALSLLPGGPIGTAAKFAAQTAIDRLDTPTMIGDALTGGEKGTKYRPNQTPWWEMGDGVFE